MALDVSAIGAVGTIPVIGPIVLGIAAIVDLIGAIFGFSFGGVSAAQVEAQLTSFAGQVSLGFQQSNLLEWSGLYALGKVFILLHDLLAGFIGTLWDALKKLGKWLKDLPGIILPAILGAIKKLKNLLDDLYKNYIRWILKWLQYLRQILAILRIFHIGWATKLDAFLGNLQARIINPFLYTLRTLNGIGTWVNLIITATGVIQRAVFLNTMYRYQSDWIPMWWTGQTASTTPATPAAPTDTAPTIQQVDAWADQALQTQSGPYWDAYQRSLAASDQLIASS